MADIKTTVLEINTGGAITNIKEFKQHIEDLKGKLLGLEKGTEEYNQVAKELQSSQQKLNEVMDVAKGKGEAVEGSYDNLVATMRELKKAWRATGDEVERKQLGEKILGINDKLKELDASTGNFQRNVGNYANSFSEAFTNLTSSIGGSVPAVGKLNNAFKLLMGNPIVAFFAAISAAIMAVVNSIKNSESQLNRMKVATAGVKVVIDAFKNAITKVSDAVVTLTEKVANLINNGIEKLGKVFRKLGLDKLADATENYTQKVAQYTEEEQKAVDVAAKRRKINEEIARTENRVASLRAKIADKEKYSEQERLKFIDEWEKAEKHRAQLAVDLAQEELNIIKAKNARTDNSTKDYDAESDAVINLTRAQGQYEESLRRINQQRSALLKGDTSTSQVDENEKVVQQILNRLEEAKKTEIQKLTEKYETEKALLIQYGKDTTDLTAEYEAAVSKIEEDSKKETEQKIAEIQKRISDSTKNEYQIRLENLQERYNTEKEILIANNEDITALEAYYASERQKILDEQQAKEDAKRASEIEKERQVLEEKRNLQMDFAKSSASILSTAGDAWMNYIKAQVESGKMSKEEGERQFEAAKALQISSAIINTIAGAVGAFMGITKDTGGWGIAAAAATAAAVTAAGVAQIVTIANTKLGDTASNITTPNVAEISNDYTPEYVQNVTADTELSELTNAVNNRIAYVSVTDIEDKQNLVKVRDTESTY